MKKLAGMFQLIIGVTAVALSAVAQSAEPKFWVNETDQTVVVAVNPMLNVKLIKLAVDNDNYGRLDVSLNYVSKDMIEQIQSIMHRYPNYKEQRVITESEGTLNYRVPLLGISRDVQPTRGVEGPYILDEIYLSKNQFLKLRSQLNRNEALVEINGLYAGSVPVYQSVERKELESSICIRILAPGETVGSLISKVAFVAQSDLMPIRFQYDSTRASLIQDIQDNCFELVQKPRVSSFSDVMKLELRVREPGRSLVGETFEKRYVREVFPLAYKLQQEGVE